ncbi:D-glycero-beta-D-manno-heptose-7-phosphate kinase [Gluconobacter wancherniae]|nr:D-glycero-beta-D-manno-heptose-7-phosphate kinase [Gluconobacter wancherniae]MBF0854496.1 D-glycero-beta-D-manno-heptose-7-phosphate kinase [Gluconobacter wancherniae]GBD57560.1 bifunctional protein HldE [Gluconobacter wancherniae NBRC 103581]
MIDNFAFGQVAIIGDLLLDCYISGSVSRISPEAPVPVLLRANHTAVPGGAANVALNAATLGCSVTLVGLVGDDESAHKLRSALAAQPGIDISGLVIDPAWTTITKTRVLSGRQQIVRIDEERVETTTVSTRRRLVEAAQVAIAKADVVICSDYAKGVLTDEVLAAIFEAAKQHGVPVIVDPKRRDFTAYRGADLITPNRSELGVATNMPLRNDEEIERAARIASGQFGGHVLVTRSEEGMTLFRKDERVTHVQVRKSEVYDVSGAGDTVVATVASVLSAGQDLETAVVIATSAASIVVGKLGTAAVSRAELSAALINEMKEDEAVASLERAKSIIEQWHHHGARVVFTNGCFDLVHPGHIALIRAAASQGDKLIVALNSDASVRRLKGETRPLQDERARATVMGALRDVDMVVIFNEDTPLETIQALRPDVVVKGADYQEHQVVGGDFVKSYGGSVVLVDIVSGRSTTSIVKKMQVAPASSPLA